MKNQFTAINMSKANFDDIYTREDPRDYVSVLGALDYMIPDLAEPVLRQLLAARCQAPDTRQHVLDVGCSYGINAAIHRFPLSFGALRARYARHEMMALHPKQLARLDRNFYASWPDVGLARFTGLDISAPAIRYAVDAGLLENGLVTDLEREELTGEQAAIVRQTDVVLSTGCIGYVTEKTYTKLLQAMEKPPWVVSFVLRMFPVDKLADALGHFGLITEKLENATFVQRRFRDVQELTATLEALGTRGIDPRGFECEGTLQAELYVSRPPEDVRAMPLDELITITSGRNRQVGTRYVQVETDDGTRIALEP